AGGDLGVLDPAARELLEQQRGPIEDSYPLSPLQEGLLFHTLLAPESGVYVVQHHGILEGTLDLEVIKNAWQQVAQRHEMLRTSFAWEGLPRPIQLIHPHREIPLLELDWRDLPEEE